jgi:hypothetical protein
MTKVAGGSQGNDTVLYLELVLGSSVRFGFSSIFRKTETETGPPWLEFSKTGTETVKDRSTAVFCGCKTGLDQLRFRPVVNRSQTGLVDAQGVK